MAEDGCDRGDDRNSRTEPAGRTRHGVADGGHHVGEDGHDGRKRLVFGAGRGGAGGVGDARVAGVAGTTVMIAPGGTSTNTDGAVVATWATATAGAASEPVARPPVVNSAVTGAVPGPAGAGLVRPLPPPFGSVVGPCAETPVGAWFPLPPANPATTSAAAATPLAAATARLRAGLVRHPSATTAGTPTLTERPSARAGGFDLPGATEPAASKTSSGSGYGSGGGGSGRPNSREKKRSSRLVTSASCGPGIRRFLSSWDLSVVSSARVYRAPPAAWSSVDRPTSSGGGGSTDCAPHAGDNGGDRRESWCLVVESGRRAQDRVADARLGSRDDRDDGRERISRPRRSRRG